MSGPRYEDRSEWILLCYETIPTAGYDAGDLYNEVVYSDIIQRVSEQLCYSWKMCLYLSWKLVWFNTFVSAIHNRIDVSSRCLK